MSKRWPTLLLVGVTLLAMGRLSTSEFVQWDDPATIALNPNFRPPTLAGFAHGWTSAAGHLYVPLTYSLWWLLAMIARVDQPDAMGSLLNPWVFHAASLTVHLLTSVLVFRILHRLTIAEWPALLGAIVFALHPLQVETIAWASGMKDLLCTMFLALAILLLIQIRQRDSARDRSQSFSGTACGALALITLLACLCKPTAIIAPIILILIDRQLFKTQFRKTMAELAPAFLIVATFALIGKLVQPPIASYQTPLHLRPLIATDALAFYAMKLLVPLHLSIDYGRTPQAVIASGSLYWTWIAPVAVAILILTPLPVLRGRRGGGSSLGFGDLDLGHSPSPPPSLPPSARTGARAGIAIALIALLPVLGLIPFTFQAFSTVADHYVYPAMIGIALLVASAASLVRRPSTKIAVTSIVTVALATTSFIQCGYWHDGLKLFAHVIELNPRSKIAHTNLAAEYRSRGNESAAEAEWRTAVAVDPDDAFSQMALFDVAIRRGDFTSARNAYHEVLRIYSSQANFDRRLAANVSLEIARRFQAQGDDADAADAAREAKLLTPADSGNR